MRSEADQRKAAPSPRQRQALDVITRSIATRGYPPTNREIGEALGGISPNAVDCLLLALERKGIIDREPRKARAITVLPTGKERAS